MLTAHFQFPFVDWLHAVFNGVYFLGHVIDLSFGVLSCHPSLFLAFALRGGAQAHFPHHSNMVQYIWLSDVLLGKFDS